MFVQQSRANLVTPMSVPPGSPRQSVGGGKGGGAVNAPAVGGKGGGQAMPSLQPTMFDMARLGPSIGSGMQIPAVSPQPMLGTAINAGNLNAFPNFMPAINSGFNAPTVMPPAQPMVANKPPALPTGIVGRLYGIGGI